MPATIFRGPLFSPPRAARPRDLGWTDNNLLVSTLGGPAPEPFRQQDWQNPIRRKQAGEITAAANLLLTVLAVAVAAAPFNQTDWPTPRGPVVAQDALAQNNLLETTLATPFRQADWSLPWRGRAEQLGFSQNLLETTLAPAPVAAPFAQWEWPNPALRIERSDPTFSQSLLETTLSVAPAGAPFATTDWPIPIRQERPGEFAADVNQLLTVLAPTAPAPTAGGPALERRGRADIRIPWQVFTYDGHVTVYVGGAGETVFQAPRGDVHSFRGRARVRLGGDGASYSFTDPADEIRRLDDELMLML